MRSQTKTLKVANLIALLGWLLLGVACSKVEFQKDESPSSDSQIDAQGLSLSETTILQKNQMAIDIVWIVDDSSSMKTELPQVQKNIDAFVQTLKARSNVKMALISSSSAIQIPATNDGLLLQLDSTVTSKSPLAALINSVLPLEADLAGMGFSPKSRDRIDRDHQEIRGALKSFFRPGSLRVIVFVTDDNSDLGSGDFETAYRSVYGTEFDGVVHSFIGMDKATSPCIANPGTIYAGLTQRTGGLSFDICKPNWESSFSTIAVGSLALAENSVVLSRIPEVIEQVTVNGRPIAPDHYALSGQRIKIVSAELGSNLQNEITVRYRGSR